MRLSRLALAAAAASMLPPLLLRADITFLGSTSIPGTALDRSGQTGTVLSNAGVNLEIPAAIFGGAGSAIDYSGADNLYLMASDRGPNNGDAQYFDRIHTVRITLQLNSSTPLTASITETTLLSNAAGNHFTGSSAAFPGASAFAPPETLRLDPEGIRLAHDPATPDAFWISDEYGPYLLKFNRQGKQISSVPLPAKYAITSPNADTAKEIAANATGRITNRGMEGLAITPDGKLLVGIMQSALIQDHALDAAHERVSTFTRLITVSPADNVTHEFAYPLDSSKMGVSEILAISNHEFLVLERDSTRGSNAAAKKIYKIDLAGATDISTPFTADNASFDYSGATTANSLPAAGPVPGLLPVSKTLFLDLLNPAFHLRNDQFPEKIEGLTWGPALDNGDKLLIVTSDNDFNPAAPTWFYAFRVSGAANETAAAK